MVPAARPPSPIIVDSDGSRRLLAVASASCAMKRTPLAAIDGLRESYRIVLVLRDVEEFSAAEAAEMLGLPPATVKARLHRGRLALREQIVDLRE